MLVATVMRFVRSEWMTLLLVGAIAVAWLLLRTHSSGASSVAEFQDKVRAGHPIVVEFYSNS